MNSILYVLASFLAGWFALSALGTALGAQFILYYLSTMGATIDANTWFVVTFSDLFGMLPIISLAVGRGLWSLFLGLGFVLAMTGAWAAIKWAPPVFANNQAVVYSVAGFVGVMVLLLAMAAALPVTPIAAARSTFGLVLQGVAGGVAGYVYFIVRQQFPDKVETASF